MNILCTPDTCPVLLNATCVFYRGEDTLVYTGITSGDNLQTALEKIDAAIGAGGGGGTWGSITGNILNQTDLISYLSSTYVPLTRNITINGTTYDLSQDRSWSINAAIWGNITGTITDQTDLINYLSSNYYPLSSNPAGYITGAQVPANETDPVFTAWLAGNPLSGYVPTSRNITINGITYDLSADRTWTIAAPAPASLLGSYKIDTSGIVPPSGTGDIRYNNATQISATQLYISHLTDNNVDIDIFLSLIKVGDIIIIQDQNLSDNYQFFEVNGTPSLALSTWTFPVVLQSSGGTGSTNFANNHEVFLATFHVAEQLTLQDVYDNSVVPQILTDATRGAFTIRRGSAADTNTIIEGQNGAGTTTFSVTGNGRVMADDVVIGYTTPNAKLHVRGPGTTTGNILLLENNSGTERVKLQDNGVLFIGGSAGSAGQVITSNGPSSAATWSTPPANSLYLDAVYDGQGTVILVNSIKEFTTNKAGTIVGWSIVARGTSPTCSIDVWKIASGTSLPTVANSITSTKPALSIGNVIYSTNLSGFTTTTFSANDIWAFNVHACSDAVYIEFKLYVIWS